MGEKDIEHSGMAELFRSLLFELGLGGFRETLGRGLPDGPRRGARENTQTRATTR